jgi:ABC-2 type transport system ATP-binding protein
MDEAVRKDFYRALLKDYLAYPRTILLSSHHLTEIEDLLEDVLLIKDGKTCLHLSLHELKKMAIGLSGETIEVNQFVSGKEVYYSQENGRDRFYVVVKNDFSEEDLQKAKLKGIEISSVAPADLCVYVTNKTKGGIDDVFNRG